MVLSRLVKINWRELTVSSSVISPASFILFFILLILKDELAFLFEPNAVSVSKSEASALSPPVYSGEALIAITGFSFNSPENTSQSNAFFKTPGTPKAYSGVENITPSASLICWEYEFHYTLYPAGSFYKRHLDYDIFPVKPRCVIKH